MEKNSKLLCHVFSVGLFASCNSSSKIEVSQSSPDSLKNETAQIEFFDTSNGVKNFEAFDWFNFSGFNELYGKKTYPHISLKEINDQIVLYLAEYSSSPIDSLVFKRLSNRYVSDQTKQAFQMRSEGFDYRRVVEIFDNQIIVQHFISDKNSNIWYLTKITSLTKNRVCCYDVHDSNKANFNGILNIANIEEYLKKNSIGVFSFHTHDFNLNRNVLIHTDSSYEFNGEFYQSDNAQGYFKSSSKNSLDMPGSSYHWFIWRNYIESFHTSE